MFDETTQTQGDLGGRASRRQISVVLADPQRLFRAGLQLVIEGQPELSVAATADDLENAARYARGHHPDVLVIDLPAMASREGIVHFLDEFGRTCADTKVVIVSQSGDPITARDAIQAGASGYVLKADVPSELLEALRKAAAGESYLSPAIGAAILSLDGGVGELSERETDVLRLLALGHTNAEIAKSVHLSVRTVESHRAAIQDKLEADSRAQLVRYALDHGLVS